MDLLEVLPGYVQSHSFRKFCSFLYQRNDFLIYSPQIQKFQTGILKPYDIKNIETLAGLYEGIIRRLIHKLAEAIAVFDINLNDPAVFSILIYFCGLLHGKLIDSRDDSLNRHVRV